MKRPLLLALTLLIALPAFARVKMGVDVLSEEEFIPLKGDRVALITNHTGVDGKGRSTAELLKNASNRGVKLVNVMSPEHGFTGLLEHGENVADSTDTVLGVPVYSLYGATTRPTDKMLTGVDTIVFDIQDIGTRFYTYITTMGQALEEAAKRKIRFVVLDRPNPIGGTVMEGDVLDADVRRMTGYFEIPTRHAFTVGELAQWMNKTRSLGARVDVIKTRHWTRELWFDQTGHQFRPTSPNIPTLVSALLYAGIGCFEATNISVGRGTDTPFEVFGAPWINGAALADHLRIQKLPGMIIESAQFIPSKDVFAGEACEGVKITVTDRNKARPFSVFIHAFFYLMQTYPDRFKPEWEEIRVMTGSNELKNALQRKETPETLLKLYEEKQKVFHDGARAFYLY